MYTGYLQAEPVPGGLLQVKTVKIAIAAASGAQQLVAAVSGKKIRVLMIHYITDTATTIALQDDAGTPVVLIGAGGYVANEGMVAAAPPGCFIGETTAGQDLDLNLGTASTVGGFVVYVEV